MEATRTYEQLVRDLAKPGEDILKEMTPKQAHLLHMVVGASGEAGELLDAVKKHVMYQKPLDLENVIEELGDMEFFMQGLRDELGITREQTLDHNHAKLEKRYGQKYSNNAAQVRSDKAEVHILCRAQVIEAVAQILGLETDQVKAESKLIEDLGCDSLDMVEIAMKLEEKFGIEIPDEDVDWGKLQTVEDIKVLVEKKMSTK